MDWKGVRGHMGRSSSGRRNFAHFLATSERMVGVEDCYLMIFSVIARNNVGGVGCIDKHPAEMVRCIVGKGLRE